MYFKLYPDNAKQWRWTLYSANHEKIADSAEGYVNETDARHGIDLVKSVDKNTPVR